MFSSVPPEEVVASLSTTDCTGLSDREAVGVMVAAAAVAAWAESMVLSSVARLRSLRQQEYRDVVGARSASGPAPASGLPSDLSIDVPTDEAEVDRFCATEVAVALRVSHRAATDKVRLAAVLVDRLPGTMAGLGSGRLGLAHARAVAESVEVLDDGVALRVDGELMLAPPGRTPPQLAADARRAATASDPGYAAARCRQARAARRASTWGLPDGVSALQVTGPSETVAGAWARVDAIARRMQDEARAAAASSATRAVSTTSAPAPSGAAASAGEGGAAGRGRVTDSPSLDQLRADAVLGLLAGTPDLLRHASDTVAVHVDVVVPLATALGGSEPAELPGVGVLPAEVGRGLVAVARQVRVVDLTEVVGPDGHAAPDCDTPADPDTAPDGDAAPDGDTAPGGETAPDGDAAPCGDAPSRVDAATDGESQERQTYRPSARTAALVRLRDRTCRFPGCRRRARACDLDHTVPFPHGPTAPCNLACLCRSHHRAKHRGGWRVRQLGGGRLRWTSPTGRVTVTEPPSWCATVDRSPRVVQRT